MADTWYVWTGPVQFEANRSFLALFNAVGSGLNIAVHGCWLRNMQLDPQVGLLVEFDFYRTSSQSGGNAITPVAATTTNDALPGHITAAWGATVNNASTLWSVVTSGQDPGVRGSDTGGAGMLQLANWVPYWAATGAGIPDTLTLREGQGLNVQMGAAPSTTDGSYGAFVVFSV